MYVPPTGITLPSPGCSSGLGIAKDGSPVTCRNMDYPIQMYTQVMGSKIGQTFTSTAPGNNLGMSWISVFGFVGPNAFGESKVDDGMNTEGLYISMQALDCTDYPTPETNQYNQALEATDVLNYLLATCADCDAVKIALKNVVIWGAFLPVINKVPGLHYIVYDAKGKSIVIEIINKNIKIFNNVLRAATNDPPYDQLVNRFFQLNGLTTTPPAAARIGDHQFLTVDPAAGLLGLPGDPTSVSRCFKVSKTIEIIFDHTSKFCPPNSKVAEERMVSILDSVKVLEGMVMFPAGPSEFLPVRTQWTSVGLLKERIYGWRAADSNEFSYLDLTKLNFAPDSPPFVPLKVQGNGIRMTDKNAAFQPPI